MSIVVYSAAATEPLTVAEVMAFLQLDASNQEPEPGAITVALGSGAGNVDNGAHRYLATFVTATGETQAGIISATVTVVDKTVNGKVELTGIPIGGTLVLSRKIYRTASGGSSYLLLATISNNTATIYTDNIADASLGAGAPATNTTDDSLLNMFISSARAHAEQELRRYLVTQTLDAYFDCFPCREDRDFRLPPLQSVSEITYTDTDGVTQTLAADQYVVDSKSEPARISEAYGCSWPSSLSVENAVKIRFIAGYGAAAAVPSGIKNWMLVRIRTLYERRSNYQVDARGLLALPVEFVDGLLDPYRVPGHI